ncbi:MAG: enoyl-CoA hydratase/isomerase family protein [Candidatus Omnitrophica bacterium]|nr:enoyl-CoA hydratase/isomerase family protein [Candidatus Omnitrophota bacterium]
MSVYYKEEGNIGTITFDAPDSKVNVLSSPVIAAFEKILDEFKNTSAIKAVVIQSAKNGIFIAGADIKEIENITAVSDGKAKSQAGQRVLNKIEDLPLPTVAVIDGAALGGGCELALACRYRVATFNDKVRIGLPEVNLGFVPGFGGTYRLPRLIGLQAALKLILSGNPVNANAALKMGLVDRLYPQAALIERIKELIAEIIPYPRQRIIRRPSKKGFDAFLDRNPFGQNLVFKKSLEEVNKAAKGFYPAPVKALETIRKTLRLEREHGLDIESTAFAQLAVTPLSKNLLKVFFLSEKFKKLTVPGLENIQPVPMRKGAVIGAGIMGGGIAQLLSNRGVWVRVKDINLDAIAKGLKAADDVYKQMVRRRRMKPHERNAKMAMISGTLDYSGFQNADMVIEAVVEDMDIKKKIFAEIGDKAPRAVLATNTSSLSVTEMAKAAKDPSRVIGFHFFNPVHRMPLIEIITTARTSPQTLVSTLEFAKRLGKVPIIVKDGPGFLVNRILLGYINEAGRLLQEGGSIEHLDKVAVDFGMPMGPFTLSDEVGLDVGVKVLHILEAGLGPRFKAAPVLDQVVEKKLLGKKSGKGFYIHGTTRTINPQVAGMVKSNEKVSDQEAIDRMVYIMVNEAAMILQEGIVDGPDTVDIGMIMGTGFPPFRGGLLRYADSIGVDNIVKTLEAFEDRFKDGRFKPCAYILDLKKQGKKFYAASN